MGIESITTGPNDQRGTYIHPRLAVDFARPTHHHHHHHTTQPITPGITVSVPTEREAMQLWQTAIETDATRSLRLTLGTEGRTESGLRLRPSSPYLALGGLLMC